MLLEEYIKISRFNKVVVVVMIIEFIFDNRICLFMILKVYIKEIEILRNGENKLFISFIKFNKVVLRDMIFRWIK